MVELYFFFEALKKFRFPTAFIDMTKILFKNALASIKVNRSQTKTVEIGCDVRQGCPLAPFFFFGGSRNNECNDQSQNRKWNGEGHHAARESQATNHYTIC